MVKIANTGIIENGDSKYILLPFKIRIDEAFPFKDKDSLLIRIIDGKLVIEKEADSDV